MGPRSEITIMNLKGYQLEEKLASDIFSMLKNMSHYSTEGEFMSHTFTVEIFDETSYTIVKDNMLKTDISVSTQVSLNGPNFS